MDNKASCFFLWQDEINSILFTVILKIQPWTEPIEQFLLLVKIDLTNNSCIVFLTSSCIGFCRVAWNTNLWLKAWKLNITLGRCITKITDMIMILLYEYWDWILALQEEVCNPNEWMRDTGDYSDEFLIWEQNFFNVSARICFWRPPCNLQRTLLVNSKLQRAECNF